jgi:ketopantoate reductase
MTLLMRRDGILRASTTGLFAAGGQVEVRTLAHSFESLTPQRAWANRQHNLVVPTAEVATLTPPALTSGLNDPMVLKEIYDYVAVSTKQLPEKYGVASLIAPLITPSFTSIILTQNGLNIHLPLIKAFPQNVTMSAVSMIGSFTEGTNKIKHIGHHIL